MLGREDICEYCGFTCVTIVRPTTHAWLWTIEIPRDRYYTWRLWAAIMWVPTTPKQDTITDMQCGCPFVWFMGDVVANVASVSFRGSGKLQIFPSQQEVQTWKKGRTKRWWAAGRSWKEAGISEGTVSLTARQMKITCPTTDTNPAFKGVGWNFTWKQCGQNETPWTKIQGTWVLFLTSHHVVNTVFQPF